MLECFIYHLNRNRVFSEDCKEKKKEKKVKRCYANHFRRLYMILYKVPFNLYTKSFFLSYFVQNEIDTYQR